METEVKTISIPVGFDCDLEIRDLKSFQAEGHWVSGLVDDKGFRRPWSGDKVYILTIRRDDAIVARAQGDSVEDVQARMVARIGEVFWSAWLAQRLQAGSLAGYYNLKELVDRLDGQLVRMFGEHPTKTTFELALEIATRWYRRPLARLWRALKRT